MQTSVSLVNDEQCTNSSMINHKQTSFDHSVNRKMVKKKINEKCPSSVTSSIERMQLGIMKIDNAVFDDNASFNILKPVCFPRNLINTKRQKLRSAILRNQPHLNL